MNNRNKARCAITFSIESTAELFSSRLIVVVSTTVLWVRRITTTRLLLKRKKRRNMSNMQSLVIVAFLMFLPLVFSRECYQCLSSISWKDCDDSRYKVRCLTSQQCIKVSGSSSTEKAYGKGCAATCSASDIPVCNEPGVKCNVDCCSSDYCNGAPGHMVSGLLLMACVPIATGIIYLFGY